MKTELKSTTDIATELWSIESILGFSLDTMANCDKMTPELEALMAITSLSWEKVKDVREAAEKRGIIPLFDTLKLPESDTQTWRQTTPQFPYCSAPCQEAPESGNDAGLEFHLPAHTSTLEETGRLSGRICPLRS